MLCSTFFKLLKIQTKLSCSVGFSNEANVYIHWPYCRRKCNYCNFNKYLEKESEREKMVAWVESNHASGSRTECSTLASG